MNEVEAASDEEPALPDVVGESIALSDEELAALASRMHAVDADDVASELARDVIAQSLLEADASFIQRRLMGFSARSIANQLFAVLASCSPNLALDGYAISAMERPIIRPQEEPPPCSIDATCRHEIPCKESTPHCETPPLTPRKSKRLVAAASLVLSTSSSSLKSVAKPRPNVAKPPASSATPIPGVPFSTAIAVPAESPRKNVGVLKAAVRLASSRSLRPESDEASDETERSSDSGSDSRAPVTPTSRQRSTKDGLSLIPAMPAWSITLPRDPSLLEEQELASTVCVEYLLPHKLPVIGARRASVSTARRESRGLVSTPPPRRDTFLQVADEADAVAIDPLGMLGFDMRSQLALSPGVKLQAEDGAFKSGPELPLVPSKMRRATFIDESLSAAAVAPTRPQGRPSTTSWLAEPLQAAGVDDHSCSGVFSLTECAMKREDHSHNASMRSLAASHISSAPSSSTTSVKQNLFRKPSKVARPCTATAAAPCCSDHNSPRPAVPTNENEAFGDLVKQRAFQRKPSLATTTPPKRTQSRRSLAYNKSDTASANGSASPLSRRNLLCRTPSSSSTTKSQGDPLRNAASLL